MDKTAPTFYLPMITPHTSVREFDSTSLLAANVTGKEVAAVAGDLISTAPRLRKRTVDSIVESLTRAAQLWLEDRAPYLMMALDVVPRITGYSREVIARQLRHLLEQITPENLKGLAPSHVQNKQSKFSLVTQFCAGNIPGLGIEAIIYPLLARVPTFIKPSSDEPLLAAMFARTLEEIDRALAASIAVVWWEGGNIELEQRACQAADVVIVTGDDETIQALRELAPPTARFIAHPHKVSIGLVGRDFLTPATAAAIAHDVALFDQQGCLSPQVIFIESNSSSDAERFAGLVHAALEEVGGELPMGEASVAEKVRLQQTLATLQMTGALILRTSGMPFRSVILQDAGDRLCLTLNVRGGVFLCRADDLSQVIEQLKPLSQKLQCAGVAMSAEQLANLTPLLYTLGVCRVCPLGEMQRPPLGWHADGIDPVRSLLQEQQ